MAMLLPLPVNRPALRGFWLFVGLAVGLITLVVGYLSGTGDWGERALVALLISAAVTIPGLVDPYLVWWPYRIWNWLVRRFSRLAIRYVTAVAFWTIVVPLGWTSKPRTFELSPSDRSTWRQRGTQPASTYSSQHHAADVGEGPSRLGSLASWRRAYGHGEARVLTPFLTMIAALDTEPTVEQAAPRNIYTLY
jgi:hypothetical protein